MRGASVSCPAPGCDYGEGGRPVVFRARSIGAALRARDAHLVSAHPGFRPPRGALRDRVPRLD